MTEKEILDSLKYGEKNKFGMQKAESKIPNSVWETYSSFANTDGGLILFGVEEHLKEKDPEKCFTLESINNPQQRLTDFCNIINSVKVKNRTTELDN